MNVLSSVINMQERFQVMMSDVMEGLSMLTSHGGSHNRKLLQAAQVNLMLSIEQPIISLISLTCCGKVREAACKVAQARGVNISSIDEAGIRVSVCGQKNSL